MRNEGSFAYWQGYREGRITVLMTGIEEAQAQADNLLYRDENPFSKGFEAGVKARKHELVTAIRDAKLAEDAVQNLHNLKRSE